MKQSGSHVLIIPRFLRDLRPLRRATFIRETNWRAFPLRAGSVWRLNQQVNRKGHIRDGQLNDGIILLYAARSAKIGADLAESRRRVTLLAPRPSKC